MATKVVLNATTGQVTVAPLTAAEETQRLSDISAGTVTEAAESTFRSENAAAITLLRDYYQLPNPTAAQSRDALKAVIRVLRRVVGTRES